jgi:hypothetical protein
LQGVAGHRGQLGAFGGLGRAGRQLGRRLQPPGARPGELEVGGDRVDRREVGVTRVDAEQRPGGRDLGQGG